MRVNRLWWLLFLCVVNLPVASAAPAVPTDAGPIFNNMDAQNKCPNVCQRNGNGRWNGQWRTLPGTMTSTCDCEPGQQAPGRTASQAQWQEAGPLMNQFDAQQKCPGVCQQSGRSWDGNWKTTQPAVMSVCSCSGEGRSSGSRWGGSGMAPSPGAACRAQARGGCPGCSVQCAPGQSASCQSGQTWGDRFGTSDPQCLTQAQCTCR